MGGTLRLSITERPKARLMNFGVSPDFPQNCLPWVRVAYPTPSLRTGAGSPAEVEVSAEVGVVAQSGPEGVLDWFGVA